VKRNDPTASTRPNPHRVQRRHPHSIRFTEAEWARIQEAADKHGLSPAEVVRARSLGLPDKAFQADMPAWLSPGHVTLVEATYRAVHLLAAMATQSMPYEEVDGLVSAAHHALLATLDEEPAGAAPAAPMLYGRRQRNREAQPVPGIDASFNFY